MALLPPFQEIAMPRELTTQLIALKAKINQELHDVTERNDRVREQHSWIVEGKSPTSLALTPDECELRDAFRRDEVRRLALEERLKRAHLFGLHHAKGPMPTLCLTCFVDRGESSNMVEQSVRHWTGDRFFKCENKKCAAELHVTTIVDHP
jgi:hypothetical protein